ncbi:hypothetical protein CYLTODRAFT_390770 [Cylindrobasidium torrendii FP15055 ss-10]|uniref:NAD(P)-binding domain-containing protein n=1 Tax=Cylindrobasidium torrendii FP15055 ss-10 TaxID=1314674 RepID=A0A0D7BKX1_9AGAR|nr:hypothetical protein CYLTODRAFT_390770 [Cylindrobasidium torrendii FP15055 ss-10]
MSKSALIIGATGQVGRHALTELLASSHFSTVGEFGRRVTDPASLKTGKEKLQQKAIDFDNLDEPALKEGKWDIVFVTLGTTRKAAGSAEAFEKIDREYVVKAAKAARVEGASQRLVYCSSGGANPNSPFLYTKSKGLTELELAGLGYDETIVFRPGMLLGTDRSDSRPAESILGPIFGALSHVTSALASSVDQVGKAMVMAGFSGTTNLPAEAQASKAGTEGHAFTLIGNSGILSLVKTN